MNFLKVLLFLTICSQNFAFTVIAHRGLPRLFPEHTIKGLEESLKLPIDYVEPDVVLTKDKIPVVLHDIHIDTTTDVKKVFPSRSRKDGRYYAIDFTLTELKTLRANHRIKIKSGKPAIGTRVPIKNSPYKIPTLDEFIQTVLKHNKKNKKSVGIYPEIKAPQFHLNEGYDSTMIIHDKLLKIKKENPSFKIIVQCFHSKTLKRLKKMKSPFFLVQLIGQNTWRESDDNYKKMRTKKGLQEVKKYADGVGPWLYHLVKKKTKKPNSFLKDAKEIGLIVHPYTLRNDALPKFAESEMEVLFLLLASGADGIFTDNAHTTIPILEHIKQNTFYKK